MRYIFLFLVVGNLNLFAFENFFYDFSVRANYEKHFYSSALAKKMKPQKYYISDNYYVEVSNSILGDYAYYSFFNRKDGVSYIFPGSYVIKVGRRGIEQVKIFFLNRADTFIRIKANDVHSSADFYLIDTLIHKDVKLPFKIGDIAIGSFLEIAKYIDDFVDFELFNPQHLKVHENVSNIVDSLRTFLKFSSPIFEVHDGAMNELGEMVYIKTGEPQREPQGFNCSGFGKWVADSIYKTMTGKLLKIENLKVRHIGVRGNSFTNYYEFNLNPFFGLDWTRNIAYKLKNINSNLDLSKVKELDVNSIGFLKYIDNRGYEIDNLEFILYYLAVKEPGHIYFGSISTTINKFPGKLFHKHVVVLFPFIDKESIFRVSLMEVNDETSIKSLGDRYPNSYVHLVRVKVPNNISIVPIPEKVNN
ncbi:hypothetical protein [Borrelia miyamotoi]|uniref:Uncharacterized protein n=1 Tax=Borrelia miyamotoi TaxID=47466 RepID=A0AAQ2X0L4_9SPIR|nr:hypothetical protein [Borrelia miyamotoi]AGT27469.1 hypothetical protein I871_02685 [Borrelia miyamotoi LB-2001]AJA58654.1 hypothetical protein RJ61_02505 [Borrelia miyamotoi]AOW95736.1 hypothetical protein AXH25_02525 [Borrelia miyamotoi]QTL83619.1 hypothetical protein bmLB2001_000501 [Borrelia miyamotoi]WAZ85080.1 hypothetical protein O5400_01720 [Borrelia miyamotoi]